MSGPSGAETKRNDSPLFCDFVEERYLPFIQKSKRSWKVDRGNLRRHILPFLGSCRLCEITADTLTRWLDSLRLSGLAPGSCARLFWVTRYVLHCAVRWGFLESDAACKGVRLPRKSGRRPVLLDSSELVRLLDLLGEHADRPAANAIRLMLLTGAAKSEILTARWEDLDLTRGVLVTSENFTGRRRLVPLNNEALKFLRSLPRPAGVPWLFSTRRGTRLSYITREWQQLREEFGRPDLRLQDLRHSFAGHLVNMGVSRSGLRLILGQYRPEALELAREGLRGDRPGEGNEAGLAEGREKSGASSSRSSLRAEAG